MNQDALLAELRQIHKDIQEIKQLLGVKPLATYDVPYGVRWHPYPEKYIPPHYGKEAKK